MTVKELIERLHDAPPEAEVRLAYDSGCAYSEAKSVEIDGGAFIYISTEESE
jgi:hypothetical protein